MTGLEKIIQQIESDAEAQARQTIGDAKIEAEKMIAEAEAEGKRLSDEIIAKGEEDRESLMARHVSADSLEGRKSLLLMKQKLIWETISEAQENLLAMSAADYFGVLKQMILRCALPKEGVVFLNEEDGKRKPEAFENEINEALSKTGGKISISEESRRINGGFVLSYGGVEENCSMEALFESVRERLQDIAQEILFRPDAG